MKWSPDLETKVRSGKTSSARGSSCCFIRLTDEMGLKLYGTKLERDASYVALSVAAEHGLAPNVGQCVDLKDMDLAARQRPAWWSHSFKPETLYGFLTEIATPLCGDDECENRSEIRSLKRNLEEIFDLDEIADLCDSNLGFLESGEIVALDLDGRFTGLMTPEDFRAVNAEWDGHFWDVLSSMGGSESTPGGSDW